MCRFPSAIQASESCQKQMKTLPPTPCQFAARHAPRFERSFERRFHKPSEAWTADGERSMDGLERVGENAFQSS